MFLLCLVSIFSHNLKSSKSSEKITVVPKCDGWRLPLKRKLGHVHTEWALYFVYMRKNRVENIEVCTTCNWKWFMSCETSSLRRRITENYEQTQKYSFSLRCVAKGSRRSLLFSPLSIAYWTTCPGTLSLDLMTLSCENVSYVVDCDKKVSDTRFL